MKIQWIGHSCFRLIGSKTVITDPYGEIGLRFPEIQADIVTVSHGHFDHCAVDAVQGEPAVVDDAGVHRVGDVTITGYSTSHDDVQGKLRGSNMVYILSMNGLRIAHMGDLGCLPDHDVLGALRNIDLMLLPVGGHYTIDGETAAEIVRLVHPRTVVPMHYKIPGLKVDVSDAEDFLSRMENVEFISGYEAEISHSSPAVICFEKCMGQE